MSLSLHAAAHRQAYLLFATVLSITGVLFYLFQIKWLVPEFHLSLAYKIFATLGLMLQLLAAWFPDVNKLERRIHRLCAYGLAANMTVLLAFLAATGQVSNFARAVSVVVAVGMLAVWYIYIFAPKLRPYYLLYQSAYIMGFFAAILSAVYG